MPLYQYECVECGHRFDDLRSVDDRHYARCAECKSPCRIVIGRVYAKCFTPYYDYQLGAEIKSPRHKQQIVKGLGLTNIGGAKNHEVTQAAGENKKRKDEAYLNEPPTKEFLESWERTKAQYPK